MNFSSDEDDFSDFETYNSLDVTISRKSHSIRFRSNDFITYEEKEFFQRYRLTKVSAYSILELIAPHIKHKTNWNNAVTEEQMFLITLRVYATGGMLRTIADLYGVSTTTVSKVVSIVTHFIAVLRPRFIIFPHTEEGISKLKMEFYNIAKFPKVVAALDCTHVKIISPGGDNPELYRNRKGFFSINVQTMCDSHLKILNIVARWPGSAHDSNILKNSKIFSRFERGDFYDSFIVADSGYPEKHFIMTPLLDPKTPEEALYNESQIRTRNCVERSYGVWKRRFPILSLGIRLKFEKVQPIIIATAVLHNVCCINNDGMPPSLPNDIEEALNNVNTVPCNRPRDTRSNNTERQNLITGYFKNLL